MPFYFLKNQLTRLNKRKGKTKIFNMLNYNINFKILQESTSYCSITKSSLFKEGNILSADATFILV